MRGLTKYFLLILLLGTILILESTCNNHVRDKLRKKDLTESVEGKITGISKSRYGFATIYSYSYKVEGKLIKTSQQMKPIYEGIQIGSPVNVIYLKDNPRRSRLVWTRDDFKWIE